MSELTSEAPRKATAVHGYWLDQSNGPFNVEGYRGSFLNRMAVRAAALLHEREGGKLIHVGARLEGPSYPATSAVSKAEWVGKYGVPERDIVVNENGYGTAPEGQEFGRIARDEGIKDLTVVAWGEHRPSVERFSPRVNGVGVRHEWVTDILEKHEKKHTYITKGGRLHSHESHYLRLAKRYERSLLHYGFVAYEVAKTIVMSLPGGRERLYRKSKEARLGKDNSKISGLIQHTIDVFK